MTRQAPDAALLLVDLQNDFLERPGLIPAAEQICARAATLLAAARRRGLPVAHAHTLTRADGSDRMPHWKRQGLRECVEGTPGALAPPSLAPLETELVVRKTYFSAFGDARLDAWLRRLRVRRLIVAGVYLHGCVRSTVLDAYERGYEVHVAEDAVGTTEAVHGEITRQYLSGRAATFRRVDEVLSDLSDAAGEAGTGPPAALPAAVIGGQPRPARRHALFVHRDPCRARAVLARVPLAGATEIEEAAAACARAARAWARESPAARAELLERWALELESRREAFADLIVREQAKPRRFVEEEIGRACAHARIAAELARDPGMWSLRVAPGVTAVQRPLGVVGLVTPWNNPLAIPVGKIAPALAFGNAAVWKPSPRASLTALAVGESLERAGLPGGLVNLVLGEEAAAGALCRDPRVAAVAVTGSIATGRALAALCADSLKPLQAELGGNNAAIILRDADLDADVPMLVRGAFGFAGQRCTAVRRFVVERPIAERFELLARAATESLRNGDPSDSATDVGPLISVEKRDAVLTAIERAVAGGARVVTGGTVPATLAHGAWMAPALLAAVDPRSPIAQEEMFAPVAVILEAGDLDEALALANGVPHGLVLSAHTRDEAARARIRDDAEAGILQMRAGPLAVHPRAPFSGWKGSGAGPPEHGIWDAAFYTRTQALYEEDAC